MPEVELPHFSIPFRFEKKQVGRPVRAPNDPTPLSKASSVNRPVTQTVMAASVEEQDDIQEIENCIEVILRYPKGFRIDDSDFGTPDQLFKMGGAEPDEIIQALQTWEDRVNVLVEVDNQALDRLVTFVRVTIREKGDQGAGIP